MNNAEVLKKADMALSDLATAGKLNPEQADQFIRTLIDQPTLLSKVRTKAMNASEMKINKIGFGSRILRPAVESTALAQGDRSKPDLGQVNLATKEVIAEVRIPYAVMEDNIERAQAAGVAGNSTGGLHNTIVEMIAERAALDLEELAILGDTASGDAYLALQNGFLKLATANGVAAGAAFSKDVIKAGIKAMPDKYLRNRNSLIHFVSTDNETELRDQYGNRMTALGDQNVVGATPLFVFGTKVEPVALMPAANGLFTDPKNLIFGVQRDISIEFDKDIRTREYIIVLTSRVGFAIEEINAVVKYTGIL